MTSSPQQANNADSDLDHLTEPPTTLEMGAAILELDELIRLAGSEPHTPEGMKFAAMVDDLRVAPYRRFAAVVSTALGYCAMSIPVDTRARLAVLAEEMMGGG